MVREVFEMKRQTIVRHEHERNAGKERQLILAITGPLKGLVYIIFLPVIGIFAIFMLGIRKLVVRCRYFGNY